MLWNIGLIFWRRKKNRRMEWKDTINSTLLNKFLHCRVIFLVGIITIFWDFIFTMQQLYRINPFHVSLFKIDGKKSEKEKKKEIYTFTLFDGKRHIWKHHFDVLEHTRTRPLSIVCPHTYVTSYRKEWFYFIFILLIFFFTPFSSSFFYYSNLPACSFRDLLG